MHLIFVIWVALAANSTIALSKVPSLRKDCVYWAITTFHCNLAELKTEQVT